MIILRTEKYAMVTPGDIRASRKTVDIPFNRLAESHDLQLRLGLLEAVYIKPAFDIRSSNPIRSAIASYLAEFTAEKKERDRIKNYLDRNGMLRILIENDKLREDIVFANLDIELAPYLPKGKTR